MPSGSGSVKGTLLNARLLKSMAANPAEFTKDMRGRLLGHLQEEDDGANRMQQYVRGLPLEKQVVMGYFLMALAHLDLMMHEGKVASARLLVLRLVACLEQQMLDGHWRFAWNLTGLDDPPWTVWARSSVAEHRKAHTASPLLNEVWVEAAIGKSRADLYLRKQQFNPGADGAAEKPAGGGRGR